MQSQDTAGVSQIINNGENPALLGSSAEGRDRGQLGVALRFVLTMGCLWVVFFLPAKWQILLPIFTLAGGVVLDGGEFTKQVEMHSFFFLPLHSYEFILMPNNAIEGNAQGESPAALDAFRCTQQGSRRPGPGCWLSPNLLEEENPESICVSPGVKQGGHS